MSKKKGRIGSAFEDFLKEEGTCEETTALAVKCVLAWQLEEAMAKQSMGKKKTAKSHRNS